MVGDRPLRRDIHLLGDLLGEVIQEQAGLEGFELEEQVRRLARARRAGDPEAEGALRALLEERARARQRRDYARADEIRRLLYERGIILEDTRSGTLWRRRRDLEKKDPS